MAKNESEAWERAFITCSNCNTSLVTEGLVLVGDIVKCGMCSGLIRIKSVKRAARKDVVFIESKTRLNGL